MSASDVEQLFRTIMSKSPAERLQLAGMLLLADPGKVDLAISIAERAVQELRVRQLLAKKDPK